MKQLMALLLMLFGSLVQAQTAVEEITGKWLTPKNVEITIAEKDNGITGINQTTGRVVLDNITAVNDVWKGTIITPEGKKVKCELQREGETLKVKAKKGMLSKTLIWRKVE